MRDSWSVIESSSLQDQLHGTNYFLQQGLFARCYMQTLWISLPWRSSVHHGPTCEPTMQGTSAIPVLSWAVFSQITEYSLIFPFCCSSSLKLKGRQMSHLVPYVVQSRGSSGAISAVCTLRWSDIANLDEGASSLTLSYSLS